MVTTLYALCMIVLTVTSYGVMALLIEVTQHTAR